MRKEIDKSKAGAGDYSGKLGYLNWEDGETKFLRFLSPDPLIVGFYEFVPDNQGKNQNFIAAPDLYVDDPTWKGEDWVLKYGGKMRENGMNGDLVTPFARKRGVAIAVVREEKFDGKKVVGYQDKLTEIEFKGEKFPSRQFVVVKQGLRNFWDHLDGLWMEYGTICDRDYKITRKGARTDTNYHPIPKSEFKDDDFTIEALHVRYGYGTGRNAEGEALTPDSPDRFLYCPQTLEEWAETYASEDRVKFFLGDPRAEAQSRHDGEGSGNDEAQAASPSSTSTDFDALRARLETHKTASTISSDEPPF